MPHTLVAMINVLALLSMMMIVGGFVQGVSRFSKDCTNDPEHMFKTVKMFFVAGILCFLLDATLCVLGKPFGGYFAFSALFTILAYAQFWRMTSFIKKKET